MGKGGTIKKQPYEVNFEHRQNPQSGCKESLLKLGGQVSFECKNRTKKVVIPHTSGPNCPRTGPSRLKPRMPEKKRLRNKKKAAQDFH